MNRTVITALAHDRLPGLGAGTPSGCPASSNDAHRTPILNAFANLGFQLKNAHLEVGHIPGTSQQLPFYQEIEYFTAPSSTP